MTLSLVAQSSGEGIAFSLIKCDVCDVATTRTSPRRRVIATHKRYRTNRDAWLMIPAMLTREHFKNKIGCNLNIVNR
jgi:hypothetical protein